MGLVVTVSCGSSQKVYDFLMQRTDRSQFVVQLVEEYLSGQNRNAQEEDEEALEELVSLGYSRDYNIWCSIHKQAEMTTTPRDFMKHKDEKTFGKRLTEVMGYIKNEKNSQIQETPTNSDGQA
jgi:hypothetical protein